MDPFDLKWKILWLDSTMNNWCSCQSIWKPSSFAPPPHSSKKSGKPPILRHEKSWVDPASTVRMPELAPVPADSRRRLHSTGWKTSPSPWLLQSFRRLGFSLLWIWDTVWFSRDPVRFRLCDVDDRSLFLFYMLMLLSSNFYVIPLSAGGSTWTKLIADLE